MHRNKLKCLKDLNIRQNTIKLLEGNIGKTLWYQSYKSFLRSVSHKSKNKPVGPNETDKLLQKKENHKKKKKTSYAMGENSFKWCNDATDKDLISKIYKQLTQLNSKKYNNPTKKWAEVMNRHFSKEGYMDGQQAHEKMLNITYY